MATAAQITANRANAQKSTGPRSVEGKSASRFNALKHGIDAASVVIPGEAPPEYEPLAAAYRRDFRPQSPPQLFQTYTILRPASLKPPLPPPQPHLPPPLLPTPPPPSP